MKRKHVSLLLALTLILSTLVLASCSEAEPLPEGVSALPDLDASELTASLADETGEIQWPAELLPDDMPAAEYTEIYSVERVDNEVTIILFGEYSPSKKTNAKAYMQKLLTNGYVPVDDTLTKMRYYYNKEGYRIMLAESNNWTGEYLQTVNEKSPTGYTYEIKVFQTGKPTACLFWQFPDANTDLELKPMTFDEWPTEYLPEAFPRPGDEIEIIKMNQGNNGLFITIKGEINDVAAYQLNIITEMDFIGQAPYRNENGEYMFYQIVTEGQNEAGQTIVEIRLQVCPDNNLIQK